MDSLVVFLNHYFDIVFARTDSAQVWQAVVYTLASFSVLYLIFALPGYFIFSRASQQNQINSRSLEKHQLKNEIKASLQSIVMFGVLSGVGFYLFKYHLLTVNGDILFLRWVLEVFLLYCWNEVHFYFVHRLLHTPWLYKYVHNQHHRSIRVTPFACWRFHWLESMMLGSVLPMSLIFYNFSVWSLMMLPVVSIFWNIIGHSNWRTAIPVLGKASGNHALHHSRFNGNYGFSTPLLDKMLGTQLS